jgi:MtfA peptidase
VSTHDAGPGPLDLLFGLFGGGKGNCELDDAAWMAALRLPMFGGLTQVEHARLRELAISLLADKAFSGAGELEVDDAMATIIAAFAVLPVLNLGYDWYQGWREIVVYPGEYVYDGEQMDMNGVVHRVHHVRSGEAMTGGPMVLSWQDVQHCGQGIGFNVVIHEFAHKLDMQNGHANGRPPLHEGMSPDGWAHDFQMAYDDICRRVEGGKETPINPYASEDPAEFFAVLSEYFFEAPSLLHGEYPAIYAQLTRFYRQDPLLRLQQKVGTA